MLRKLTTEFHRETQMSLIGLALLSALMALLFAGGALGARAIIVAAGAFAFLAAYAATWLVLMVQIWVNIAPKGLIRLFSNFFFVFSVFAIFLSVFIPFFTVDHELPGSSALMAAGALGSGLAAFRVYKIHLSISSNVA